MVHMGVPKDAVKNKMNLEGFNGEIIYMEPTTLSKIALKQNQEMLGNIPIPPPPPPALGTSAPVKINPLDLQNVKLKKTVIKEKVNIEETRDFRIPTKNQLLEQLKNLKKHNT